MSAPETAQQPSNQAPEQPPAKRRLSSHSRVLTRAELEKHRAEAPREKPVPDKAIMGFSVVLHRRLADTLDDLTRLLRDERHQITEKLSLQKRVVLALYALDVSLDDLRPIGDGA